MMYWPTVVDFIANGGKNIPVGTVVEFEGFYSVGDGGGGRWQKTAITGPASQTPSQLGGGLLNDPQGNQWGLVKSNTIYAKKYGAGISGDSSDSLNAALNDLRGYTSSPVAGILGSIPASLELEGGVFNCSKPINATGLKTHGWEINGKGAVIVSSATGKVGLDLLTSRWGTISGLTVTATDASDVYYGIQYGRDITLATANSLVFDNVTTTGYWTRAGMFNFASEVDTHIAPTYINYKSTTNSYAFILDGFNEWGAISDYATVYAGNVSVSNIQHTFIGGSLRKLIGGPVMWMTRANQLKFNNSYITCINDHAIVMADNGESFSDIVLDVHFEATGMLSCVKFTKTSTAVVTKTTVNGFKFIDHGPQANNRIFFADGTLNVKLVGDIEIQKYQQIPVNGLCQPRPQFEIVGDVKLPSLSQNKSLKTSGTMVPYDGVLTGEVGGNPEILTSQSGYERVVKGAVVFTSKNSDNINLANISTLKNVTIENGVIAQTGLSSAPSPILSNAICIDNGSNWSGVNATGLPRPVFYDGISWIALT